MTKRKATVAWSGVGVVLVVLVGLVLYTQLTAMDPPFGRWTDEVKHSLRLR